MRQDLVKDNNPSLDPWHLWETTVSSLRGQALTQVDPNVNLASGLSTSWCVFLS